MPRYHATFVEKIYYEVYVEAENEDEAKIKAEEMFGNGDENVEVTDQYVSDFDVEEEAK